MASRPTRGAPRDDISVATELALLREILTRVEAKVNAIEVKTESHGNQIDRWKTVGTVMTPVLLGLGVLANKLFDQLLVWLGSRVAP